MVVDFCAGAGGKTLLLGALMRSQGRLYAFDVAGKPARQIHADGSRASGLSNVHPQVLASERDTKVKRLAGKIDRVLVDAPCTSFGTLRRNPGSEVAAAANPRSRSSQRSRRRSSRPAATLVKPGGRVVYATCSVLPEENEGDRRRAFLARYPRVRAQQRRRRVCAAPPSRSTRDLRSSCCPHLHGCDGFRRRARAFR